MSPDENPQIPPPLAVAIGEALTAPLRQALTMMAAPWQQMADQVSQSLTSVASTLATEYQQALGSQFQELVTNYHKQLAEALRTGQPPAGQDEIINSVRDRMQNVSTETKARLESALQEAREANERVAAAIRDFRGELKTPPRPETQKRRPSKNEGETK